MPSRLAYQNWAWESGVTITSSADAVGYPSSNLASSAPWKIWRSSATTGDQWVKFDLGSSRAMTACLLRNYLPHAGGTVRFQANATDVWGAPTVNQLFTIPSTNRTKILAAFLATQTLRWVRIYFTNTAAASQAVELGVAFVANYLQFTYGWTPGLAMPREDLSLVLASVGGQEQVDTRGQRYRVSFNPAALSPTDRDAVLAAFDLAGAHQPVLLVLDPTDPNLMIYGKVQSQIGVAHVRGSTWAAPFVVVEDL